MTPASLQRLFWLMLFLRTVACSDKQRHWVVLKRGFLLCYSEKLLCLQGLFLRLTWVSFKNVKKVQFQFISPTKKRLSKPRVSCDFELTCMCVGLLCLKCCDLWCSAGYTQVYGVYPHLNPLWFYLLQISCSKRVFTEKTTGPWTSYKVFHMWMDKGIRNSSLKMPNYVVVSPYSLTVGQYWL